MILLHRRRIQPAVGFDAPAARDWYVDNRGPAPPHPAGVTHSQPPLLPLLLKGGRPTFLPISHYGDPDLTFDSGPDLGFDFVFDFGFGPGIGFGFDSGFVFSGY